MPFVLFKVIQGVLECDCVAEKCCQGTDKHAGSASSQLRLSPGPLQTPIMHIQWRIQLLCKCIHWTVKLEVRTGCLDLKGACIQNSSVRPLWFFEEFNFACMKHCWEGKQCACQWSAKGEFKQSSSLFWECMPIASYRTEDKSRMFVDAGGFFAPVKQGEMGRSHVAMWSNKRDT